MTETVILRYGYISHWQTGLVTDMSFLFSKQRLVWNIATGMTLTINSKIDFNEDISRWDVSNVQTMRKMFAGMITFNQPLTHWNTSKVQDMSLMFQYTCQFNHALNHWNTANVTNMSGMFCGAHSFNQPLNAWEGRQCSRYELHVYVHQSIQSAT
jgi:surface protein